MATAMASLNIAAASVPVASCAVSRSSDRAVSMSSSSALFGGIRLDSATAAAPSATRSSRPFVVRAAQKSFWESLTDLFGVGKKKVADASAQAEKELNKATSEAKTASGDLSDQAKTFQADAQVKTDEASKEARKEVEAGVTELQEKVEEAVEAAQKN